ncbi:centaurin-gamma-1A isoform X2 [Toxorhynchites rutilus septentrionalis]|uniref:centaurin-gamma-1A isoform X2 n=1 Tax=Toxorhynchites rutilus septentrionalis TaxID=329112 RepID=UPI00247B143B|nr:centaurin-gamma-1A isoform X2 [Toxorhynchites rutilus septentrionalis]
MTMLAVKNFFLPERKAPPEAPKFSRMPEAFLRSIRRRSLRIKRPKTVIVEREKRKSDSFVNSQEWTISRSVPDIRLGIVGSLSSGKSALVHRYLTGSYMQEESPEGGRFKKEIQIDNQSYLLLIRDEGGPPEMQFAAWVDAVIFVFSLENESSFNAVYTYYTKMSHFRNSSEIPIILVGTQDAISERSPRVIDDSRARKLAQDLKRCSYYETCATYGLNVERVFQDACQKIVQQRLSTGSAITPTNSRPTTPQGTRLGVASFHSTVPSPTNGFSSSTGSPASGLTMSSSSPSHHTNSHQQQQRETQRELQQNHPGNMTLPHRHHVLSASSHHIPIKINAEIMAAEPQFILQRESLPSQKWGTISHGTSQQTLLALTNENNNIAKFVPPSHPVSCDSLQPLGLVPGKDSSGGGKDKELPTPTSTPTTSRKSRRRSNLFIPSSSKKDQQDKIKNGELGSGRAIPIKQGYLYKRSSKSLNKEWKKKYVTLCDDGRLTYHPSLHDYMDDIHGKEVSLQYVTVKVPGQKPRGSKSIITNSALTGANLASTAGLNGKSAGPTAGCGSQGNTSNGLTEGIGGLSLAKDRKLTEKVLLTAFDTLREPVKSNSQTSGDEGIVISNSNSQSFIGSDGNASKLDAQTPNVKKRHRRMKSSGVGKNNEYDDTDGFEFYIVSLDNKQWHFEASNSEERDEWVSVIEQEIFKSLQGIESSKSKPLNPSDIASMQSIRSRVPGNGYCVDCDSPNPEWASLNLGVLMCIECSGVHRNLGSHISKVRSLGLDEWPPGHLSVMLAIGNSLANSVWESNTRGRVKPTPASSREEKEAWIRNKYEAKEFLPAFNSASPIGQQLREAVVRSDMKAIIILLANASLEHINSSVSSRDLRTPLHLACAIGNLAISQLLIWHHANLKHIDHEGRSCLTYAKAANSLAAARQASNTPHHVNVETTAALVELLVSLGCTDPAPFTASGTLPRRRETIDQGTFEKFSSNII